jgi:hypothetical protein
VGAEDGCGGPEPGSEVAVEGFEVVGDDIIVDNGSLSGSGSARKLNGAITGCQNVGWDEILVDSRQLLVARLQPMFERLSHRHQALDSIFDTCEPVVDSDGIPGSRSVRLVCKNERQVCSKGRLSKRERTHCLAPAALSLISLTKKVHERSQLQRPTGADGTWNRRTAACLSRG